MMNTVTLAAAAVLALAPGAMAASKTPQYKGHELAAQAKVPLAGARAIALKARPGKIVDEELEREAGGSGLRYAFDVKSGGKAYEVGVDAVTGKVLENGVETAAQEAAEAKAERGETKTRPPH
jgi:uncharacterized membrane protein YkoI